MNGVRPYVALHIALVSREPAGLALTTFLRQAVPFYQSLPGVNVRLLRSLDRPGRFVEIIEYATNEAFLADKARVAEDKRMQSLLAQRRELFTEAPDVAFLPLNVPTTGGAPLARAQSG